MCIHVFELALLQSDSNKGHALENCNRCSRYDALKDKNNVVDRARDSDHLLRIVSRAMTILRLDFRQIWPAPIRLHRSHNYL